MKKEKNIIIVGGHRYDYHPGGTYHLARKFTEHGYRVAYISYFLSPFHWLFSENKKELLKRFSVWLKGGEWFNDKRIWSYVPFTFLPIYNKPMLRSSWVMKNTHRLTIPPFMKVLKKHGFHDVDILWLDSPLYGFVLDTISHKKSIIRLFDDSFFLQSTPDTFLRREKEVIERTDVVISLSHDLIRKYKKISNREMTYFPGGVDTDFFFKGSDELPVSIKISLPLELSAWVGSPAPICLIKS
ncbi:MAG: hypothetical protein L6425_11175 [Candidatus Aminicenantes bacterium]|nr:hypothetical protein [Candidatus Aminicenantes bacterium]